MPPRKVLATRKGGGHAEYLNPVKAGTWRQDSTGEKGIVCSKEI